MHLDYTHVNQILNQALQTKTVKWIIFGGGEPFLYFPLVLKSIQKARKLDFKVGVFTNGFFARTEVTAERYLHPMALLGLDKLFISNDGFHYKNPDDNPAVRTGKVAVSLGIPVSWESVQIQKGLYGSRKDETSLNSCHNIRLMMLGRAAEKLAAQLPIADPVSLSKCPNNHLSDPEEVFIDASGTVQICPGLGIGNVWREPLAKIIHRYRPASHPICGPLSSGGPYLLSETHSYQTSDTIVDSCHLCFTTRRFLLDRFPEYLAPRQVYGIF